MVSPDLGSRCGMPRNWQKSCKVRQRLHGVQHLEGSPDVPLQAHPISSDVNVAPQLSPTQHL
eukprot:14767899-Alexandrium_andersonii.AAC.1